MENHRALPARHDVTKAMDVSYLPDSLNDKQRDAVAASRTNLPLVLAGAGSGRHARAGSPYRVAAERGKLLPVLHHGGHVHQQGGGGDAPPHRPTDGYQPGGMWVGTFHGLAHRLLRAHHMDANLPQDFPDPTAKTSSVC